MKITPEQYATLASISEHIPNEQIISHAASLSASKAPPKNTAMRVRWDVLYACRNPTNWIAAAYKAGCNDEHIDTALRRLMLERGLGQFAQ